MKNIKGKKLSSLKLKREKKIIVAVSGGFDPIHIGHIRMFKEAKSFGDELVVILNNDNWLKQKKGFVFMPQEQRKEIIEAINGVNKVIFTKHAKYPKDMSVCAELKSLRPDIFVNGGDRNKKDAGDKSSFLNSDQMLCHKLGIKMIFNVGRGGKVQSSSELVKKFLNNQKMFPKNI
jgi:D-beta-D-heptose 7-phosphate kinase/D-beta-D-heptose 1-phosphate adenosyltransferase